MDQISNLFAKTKKKIDSPDKNVSREFQQYGYDIAVKLNDIAHKALYIKLAKTQPRSRIELALQFVLDYPNARSKGKLFMYKMRELKSTETT
ncbi:hypothetical protein CO180_04615 [candidate division WWE3 bacterium CG_4_9_14_3_um_filter_41_6]|uniref:Uncharacterized protein n=1 Tax=candidate division WWE3 bacterium CG_4_10_14_0_2_um_filter_41_14 TaxID=1975072 RepID=A0A2M7TLS1_UNCKA|nr:MAG: hypothetical protein COY32_00590 [candidate division WWE3 bacterium CG_4_10_14_0_2_um_filter_41_14]PJA37929.1 MAG: hypothetical protein CO180_04615 [candidate division WWE3 bacterium CG_4_9_14_3_um_filter_41_6]